MAWSQILLWLSWLLLVHVMELRSSPLFFQLGLAFFCATRVVIIMIWWRIVHLVTSMWLLLPVRDLMLDLSSPLITATKRLDKSSIKSLAGGSSLRLIYLVLTDIAADRCLVIHRGRIGWHETYPPCRRQRHPSLPSPKRLVLPRVPDYPSSPFYSIVSPFAKHGRPVWVLWCHLPNRRTRYMPPPWIRSRHRAHLLQQECWCWWNTHLPAM